MATPMPVMRRHCMSSDMEEHMLMPPTPTAITSSPLVRKGLRPYLRKYRVNTLSRTARTARTALFDW
eukprot:9491568-Pyramimonas_sp.AAC.4